jgi:peptidoglycan/LPS O-acetylase OafA/YrhL
MMATERTAAPALLVRPGYRADVDGLRAVAVAAVIAFHAFPRWVPGGFVGVDIFFVISGFLISGLILASLDNGRFSIAEFYARRARRILPALLVILIAAGIIGAFALLADEYQQLGKHIAGAAGFVSNFVLWGESGYFDNAAQTKPLLHLWSLGVEEQFYLLWPLTLVVAWKWRGRLVSIVAALLAASFLWNLHVASRNDVAAFYSPATRLWELLIGALLACAAVDRHTDQGRDTSNLSVEGSVRHSAAAAIGLIMIAVAAISFGRSAAFPGWRALVPTVGTALLIGAGQGSWLNRTLLSRPGLVWLGLISYPLYLWHWLLLSYASIISSDNTVPRDVRLGAIVLALALAALTFRCVERPIRFNPVGKRLVPALMAALIAVGVAGYAIYADHGVPSRIAKDVNDPNDRSVRLARIELAGTRDCSSIVKPFTESSYCRSVDDAAVAIVGDSHASHLFHGFITSGDPTFRRALLIGAGSCWPTLDAEVRNGCNRELRTALDTIAATPTIKTVVLAGYYRVIDDVGPKGSRQFFDGYLRTFRALHALGVRIVFVTDPPTLRSDPEVCLRRRPIERILPAFFLKPAFCTGASGDELKSHVDYDRFVARLKQADPSVVFYDPTQLFCTGGVCKVFESGKLLYWDANHLSTYGSEYVVRHLIADLESREQLAVDAIDIIHEPLDPEALNDHRSPRVADTPALVGVVDQFQHVRGQGIDIAERRKPARRRAADDVADAADVRADAGAAGGHRFDQRDRRSLVARREQKDICGRVQRRQIAAPSEKPHAFRQAEVSRFGFERSPRLSIASDQQRCGRATIDDAASHGEEQVVLFDRGQTSDGGDNGHVWIDLQRRARGAAVHGTGKRTQIEAERHDAVLSRRADAKVAGDGGVDSRRDGDDAIGHPRERSFDGEEGRRFRAAEIAFEHVTVVGVDESRACRSGDGLVVENRGRTSDRARLRHVRVHDVRPEPAEQREQPRRRARIVERGDLAAQRRHVHDLAAAWCTTVEQVLHVALAGAERTVDEQRVVPARREPCRQLDRLDRRAADVEACDNAGDANRRVRDLRRGCHPADAALTLSS